MVLGKSSSNRKEEVHNMSYDIRLEDETGCEVYDEGGYPCELNMTYNYYPILSKLFGEKSIRVVYGMRCEKSIPLLEGAISVLVDDETTDKYQPTEGNVKCVLKRMLGFAKDNPNAIWVGD